MELQPKIRQLRANPWLQAPTDPDPSKSVGFLITNQMKINKESVDEIGYDTCM
jgi:hypothetical protein